MVINVADLAKQKTDLFLSVEMTSLSLLRKNANKLIGVTNCDLDMFAGLTVDISFLLRRSFAENASQNVSVVCR